jgi:hypothetical protein
VLPRFHRIFRSKKIEELERRLSPHPHALRNGTKYRENVAIYLLKGKKNKIGGVFYAGLSEGIMDDR